MGLYTPACTGFTHKRLGGYAKQVFAHKSIGFGVHCLNNCPCNFKRFMASVPQHNVGLKPLALAVWLLVCGVQKQPLAMNLRRQRRQTHCNCPQAGSVGP